MALNYRNCAEEIFANLGGKENIISAAHCATRLRLVIADNSKVNSKALEDVEGVKGMFESNGQLQLIIGTGTVNKVYDEFLAVTGLTAASKADVKAAAASKMPWWKKILKTPGASPAPAGSTSWIWPLTPPLPCCPFWSPSPPPASSAATSSSAPSSVS